VLGCLPGFCQDPPSPWAITAKNDEPSACSGLTRSVRRTFLQFVVSKAREHTVLVRSVGCRASKED
jgi:hypothetical protein